MPNDDGTMNAAEEREAMQTIASLGGKIDALTLRVHVLEDQQRWMLRSLLALIFVVVVSDLVSEAWLGE